jgi:hypothetical protein
MTIDLAFIGTSVGFVVISSGIGFNSAPGLFDVDVSLYVSGYAYPIVKKDANSRVR